MISSKSDLFAVLRQYNPWWNHQLIADLPSWKRSAFSEIDQWVKDPPAHRAILLSGARQIGKTTLLLQSIQSLLDTGVNPQNILYATFDHPLLKLIGLNALLDLWREFEPHRDGIEYLFLDEIQYTKDWQTWIKHQIDFEKRRRIVVTGSATPLAACDQESGVGRWHTIRLATLSFYEYLHIKQTALPVLPKPSSLAQLFSWTPEQFIRVAQDAKSLTGYFHQYLLMGGFPQTAQMDNVTIAQKLLREDIVDKVLKRDMTALFGVRRILELEQVFIYLCMHGGGLLDISALCKNLEGIKKPTIHHFIDLLEATHLIYKLPPYGYGKEILRGRYKIYLADAAIAPSVLLKGQGLLENDTLLGEAVETSFFKHVFTRYYQQSIRFSYWRGKTDQEVDIIAEIGGRLVPFEVKYRNTDTDTRALKGIIQFCAEKKIERGYVITKVFDDFSLLPISAKNQTDPCITLLKIPAPLACYWLSQSELESWV